MSKRADTSKSSIRMIILVMNVEKILRDFLFAIFIYAYLELISKVKQNISVDNISKLLFHKIVDFFRKSYVECSFVYTFLFTVEPDTFPAYLLFPNNFFQVPGMSSHHLFIHIFSHGVYTLFNLFQAGKF